MSKMEDEFRKRLIEVLEAEYGSASLNIVNRITTITRVLNNLSYKHGHDDAFAEIKEHNPKVIDLFGARDTQEK